MNLPSEALLHRIFKLSIFWILLCQTRIHSVTIICEEDDGELHSADFSTVYAMDSAAKVCVFAKKVSLLNETVLKLSGEELTPATIKWLVRRLYLGMCIIIEKSSLTYLHIGTQFFTGSCKGPKVILFNNPHLRTLGMGVETVERLKSLPNTIRVRGNRKLNITNIERIKEYLAFKNVIMDIQTFGECPLPQPFTSFEMLDHNCSKFYGILTLEKEVKEIQYDSNKIHKFEIEACIQIENTNLKDVTFLNAFSRFKPIPLCSQYVKNNRNLCSQNLRYFNMYFENVEFSNNSRHPCSECMGGRVSKQFLSESENCTFIYGDLIIEGFRGLPRNIDNLRNIETVEGRLIISNNTGLEKFVYLPSLRTVGLKNASGIAFVVKNNADLKMLSMPKLVDIRLKERSERVELANNPLLAVGMNEKPMEDTAQIKHFILENTAFTLKAAITRNFGLFCSVIGAVFVLVPLCVLGAYITSRQKKCVSGLPKPPHKLKAKSREQLAKFCSDILEKNPLIWCIEDLTPLWRQNRAPINACKSLKNPHFLKSSMIPVARNGRVRQQKLIPQNKSLQLRIDEMLGFDLVLMIATVTNVSHVIPGIPCNIGETSRYGGGVVYKLVKVKQLSCTSTSFKYEAKIDMKPNVKNIELILFLWPSEQLPVDFSELLQLAALAKGRKVICISDRRKEAFSVMYFFYSNVIEAKEPKNTVDVFQLHSHFCNGAPLDRYEMLYTMRILVEWARIVKCVPGKIERKCSQWCQIYDQMAAFSKKHPNIVNIHPQHLTRLDCRTALMNEVVAARKHLVSLSERMLGVMVDQFRRKTLEEIKRELINTTKTITEEQKEAANDSIDINI